MEQEQKQQGFACTGDCLRCHANQRQYCAAQFTYNSMRMLEQMQGSLKAMQDTVEELKAKIEAIQGNEASIFDPTAKEDLLPKPISGTYEDTAQVGDGAA